MKKIEDEAARQDRRGIIRARAGQSAIAGLYIFFAFWAMHSFRSELAIASLGASTFVAFSFPNAKSSRPKPMIGGYFVGVIVGLLCNLLIMLIPEGLPFPKYIPVCTLTVFLTMLLMTILNFKHPPAVALAVAATLSSRPVDLSVAALSCIIALCFLKEALKKHLRDL